MTAQHAPNTDLTRRALISGLGLLPALPLLASSPAAAQPGVVGASVSGVFRHPGLLITEADFARIREHIRTGQQPWTAWWNKLCSDATTSLGAQPNPQEGVYRSTNAHVMYWDIQRAWCLAMRWKLSNDTRYADKAVETLDAWSAKLKEVWTKPPGSTAHEDWSGWLMAGMQGHQWAQAGEIMRTYAGWAPERLARFQDMLLRVFVGLSSGWLNDVSEKGIHLGSHANWDLASLCGTMAIGVFCDRPDLYRQAYDYYTANNHGDPRKLFNNGAIAHAVYFMHPGHLGQWQESGRDQGHATLGMSLGGDLLEMAWNQGDDLYGLHNNRFLAAAEYVARSNLKDAQGKLYALPYARERDPSSGGTWWGVNQSFQSYRNAWEPIYNHYVNRMGLAAPNVERMVALCEPNYGSGNGDDMVFPTLTHRRPAYAGPMKAPSGVTQFVRDGQVVLSWWGSAGAASYVVKRGTRSSGPFTPLATLKAGEVLTCTDTPAKGVWFYQVTAVGSDGRSAAAPAVRAAVPGEWRFSMPLNGLNGTGTIGALMTPSGTWAGFTCKLADGATWGDGRSNDKAIAFDGKAASLELPPGVFAGLEDFTVALWVYANSLHWDSCLLFVGQDNLANMRLAPLAGSGGLRFALCAAGYQEEQAIQAPTPLPTGRWSHVAVTLQAGTGRLYVDGKQVASNDSILLSPRQLGDQIRTLGRDAVHPSFNGRIQGFRVYAGAMSAAEIAAIAR